MGLLLSLLVVDGWIAGFVWGVVRGGGGGGFCWCWGGRDGWMDGGCLVLCMWGLCS